MRSAAIDWLVRETGCAAEDAAAAADLRYDGFADFARFRETLLRVVPEFATMKLDARQWRNLAGPDHAGSWVLGIARRWPAFAASLAARVSPTDPEWQAFAAQSPAAVVAHLARDYRLRDPELLEYDADAKVDSFSMTQDEALAWRMEGIPVTSVQGNGFDADAWQLYSTMRELPRDWWPKTPEEWREIGAVSRLISRIELATSLPRRQICAACAGRWKEWSARLAAIIQHVGGTEEYRLDVLGYEIFDAFGAFANQVVWPVGVRVGAVRAPTGSWVSRHLRGPERLTAARALFGDASASGILETAVKWHALRPMIDAAIARLSPEHAARMSWPAALPEFRHVASDGTEVTFVHLTSAAALAEDGAELQHCVGSSEFSTACLAGEVRIISVRHRTSDGTDRSSTVEFSFERRGAGVTVKVRQHRGLRDRKPCAADSDAVAAFLAAVSSGALTVVESELAAIENDNDLETICGYDCWDDAVLDAVLKLWAPLLRRPLRGLAFRDFAAAVGLKEREIELPPHVYLPYVERQRDIFGEFAADDADFDEPLDDEDTDVIRPGLLAGLAALWRRIGRRPPRRAAA